MARRGREVSVFAKLVFALLCLILNLLASCSSITSNTGDFATSVAAFLQDGEIKGVSTSRIGSRVLRWKTRACGVLTTPFLVFFGVVFFSGVSNLQCERVFFTLGSASSNSRSTVARVRRILLGLGSANETSLIAARLPRVTLGSGLGRSEGGFLEVVLLARVALLHVSPLSQISSFCSA